MFSAPLHSVHHAISTGTLGPLNPTPWAFMLGNCLGWVIYSYLIQNLFLLLANAPGLILSVWLNMAAAKLQYSDRIRCGMRRSFVRLLDDNRRSFRMLEEDRGGSSRVDDLNDDNGGEENSSLQHQSKQRSTLPTTTATNNNNTTEHPHTFTNLRKMALDITIQKTSIPAPHETVVVTIVAIYVTLISTLYFLHLTLSQWKFIIGLIVNINLLFFYGAPLSTIYTVLKTRDSNSIHRWTMVMNTANAVFWTAFGFGVMDWFIIVPNGLGAVLGGVQMVLRVIVPSSGGGGEEENDGGGGDNVVKEGEKGDVELGVDESTSNLSNPSVVVDDSN
eukprot:CAMPEP_0201726054 /NCGR_PEP_ID=MMETSP0593-20130828/9246_1 /ASSEMBLY_ACC=CAM_ASM_000672 /TAXON_ID=267983 /ORGANISM="Skeletonema japonicum, Strain CCMP2506" /LENGTH=332 /DNA_ID=CAMNT_0048217521 /DNA_START=204 /DNA_END=1202 /DNA_ORIENTATION=+